MCELTSAVSLTACERPALFRLLPATTRSSTKVVNQNTAAFWVVFNRYDDEGDSRLYGMWTKLKIWSQSFFCCYATSPVCTILLILCGQKLFKVFKFRNTHSKIFETFLPVIFQKSKQSVKFSFLFFRSKHITNPGFFVLLAFLLPKEGKAHMQLSPAPHNCPCWRLSRMVAADFKRRSVKMLD